MTAMELSSGLTTAGLSGIELVRHKQTSRTAVLWAMSCIALCYCDRVSMARS